MPTSIIQKKITPREKKFTTILNKGISGLQGQVSLAILTYSERYFDSFVTRRPEWSI